MRKHHKYPSPSAVLYYLYCMNFECRNSIYNLNLEIQLPLTAKNLVAQHRCKYCHMPLVSPIDLEIKNEFIKANTHCRDKPKYLDN